MGLAGTFKLSEDSFHQRQKPQESKTPKFKTAIGNIVYGIPALA